VQVAAEEIAADKDYVYETFPNAAHLGAALEQGRIFEELVQNEVILDLMFQRLGPGFLLSNVNANIAARRQADVPTLRHRLRATGRFRPTPLVANAMWCLDDFTDANGATRIVPGSHKLQRSPNYAKRYDSSPSRRRVVQRSSFPVALASNRRQRSQGRETPRHYHLLLPPVYAPARELLRLATPESRTRHAASQAALGIHHVAGRRRCDQRPATRGPAVLGPATTTRSWFPSNQAAGGTVDPRCGRTASILSPLVPHRFS